MINAKNRFDNKKRRRPENHDRQAMNTPRYILDPIIKILGGIDLDPCTEPENPTGAKTFYHLPMDGCSMPWDAEKIYVNPPYGEARNRWVEKCIETGKTSKVILLIPTNSTESKIFQKAILACNTVHLVKSRISFGMLRENGRQWEASHGSAIFGFGIDLNGIEIDGVTLGRKNVSTDKES